MTRLVPRFVAVLMLQCLATALAQQPLPEPAADFGVGSHQRRLESLVKGQEGAYRQVLASFDAHLAKEDGDPVAAVEKCRFIDSYMSAFGEGMPMELVDQDWEQCREQLAAGSHADRPDVRLYLLEGEWGDDGIAAGKELLPVARDWPAPARSALHERLAVLYEAQGNEESAGQHAVQAVRLNPGSGALMIAAERLMSIGARKRARQLLLDAPPEAWADRRPFRAAEILISLGEAQAAADLLEASDIEDWDVQSQVLLARALSGSGHPEAARRIYAKAAGQSNPAQGVLRGAFELERDSGSVDEAAAAYRRLRNTGYDADPYGHYRLSLLLRYPASPWTWDDALGPAAFVALLLVLVLLPGILIAPVHYRSLARRLRGWEVPPDAVGCWTLSSLWYVLAVLLASEVATSYVIAYPIFEWMLDFEGFLPKPLADDVVLGNVLVLVTVVTAAFCAPLFRKVDLSGLLLGRWGWGRSILTGIGVAIALRFILGAWLGLQSFPEPAVNLGTDTVRSMLGIHARYGTLALFAVAALAVPVVEEFVFRGVMLNTLARYLPFPVATGLQAALFAALHEDSSLILFFMALAVAGAILYRRSGGLLAPIAMHAATNLVAVSALIVMSRNL